MDERDLRDAFGNDHTETCLAGCALFAVAILLLIVPAGLCLMFWILSSPP